MTQPHICINSAMTQAKYALLPGDHKRLDCVAPFLTDVKQLAFNREFRSLSGCYQGIEVLVISTGVGSPSMAIALHELKNIGINNVIRIGSCGALQKTLQLGDLILANGAVRDEGTSRHYIDKQFPAVPNFELLTALSSMSKKLNLTTYTGVVRSHDTFYTCKEDAICDYWSTQGVLAADMETSALFVIAHLLGIRAASILNVVVQYQQSVEEGIAHYLQQQNQCLQGEKDEIHLALEAIYYDSQLNQSSC